MRNEKWQLGFDKHCICAKAWQALTEEGALCQLHFIRLWDFNRLWSNIVIGLGLRVSTRSQGSVLVLLASTSGARL